MSTFIDPELVPLLASRPPAPPLDPSRLPEIRRAYTEVGVPAIQAKYKELGLLPSESEYTVTDRQIDVGGGASVLARVIVPTPRTSEEEEGFPLLFWIHGSGFIIWDANLDDYKLRDDSVRLRVVVVNCEYRLAPEHPFPTAIEDLTAALKFVTSDPKTFSASLEKGFIIGGSSAGANLSAVLAHIVRDDSSILANHKLTGQLLNIPLTIHPDAYPEEYKPYLKSLEENKDAPSIKKRDLVAMLQMYGAPPADTRISPLLLSSHANLPPAVIMVCGLDLLRDDGVIYEKVLREAGVPTRFEMYPGVPHGFDGAMFFPEIKQAFKFREDFKKGVAWLLERKSDATY